MLKGARIVSTSLRSQAHSCTAVARILDILTASLFPPAAAACVNPSSRVRVQYSNCVSGLGFQTYYSLEGCTDRFLCLEEERGQGKQMGRWSVGSMNIPFSFEALHFAT